MVKVRTWIILFLSVVVCFSVAVSLLLYNFMKSKFRWREDQGQMVKLMPFLEGSEKIMWSVEDNGDWLGRWLAPGPSYALVLGYAILTPDQITVLQNENEWSELSQSEIAEPYPKSFPTQMPPIKGRVL